MTTTPIKHNSLVAEANVWDDEIDGEHGVLCVLDSTGDTKHVWDRRNADEVAAMRELFDNMKAKGFQAFSVDRKGDKSKRVTEFDASAEKIIFAPALVGG